MFRLNNMKRARLFLTLQISIHLMFRLNLARKISQMLYNTNFNTSNVSVEHNPRKSNYQYSRDFNTSNVSVELVWYFVFRYGYSISIHLMFRLNQPGYKNNLKERRISIHLMFRLNLPPCCKRQQV